LISSATPDDASADAQASFHFRLDPGRANSHKANVVTASSETDQLSRTLSERPIHESSRTSSLTAW
jgi:hypothetical protein